MRTATRPEDGVSENIGAIMLVMIVVVAVSVIGVYMFSQPAPQKIPALNALIWNDSQNIYIQHEGGDLFNARRIRNTRDSTEPLFNLTTAPTAPWDTLSIGKTVRTPMVATSEIPSVQIVFTGVDPALSSPLRITRERT